MIQLSNRHHTVPVRVGHLTVGGGAPVIVQSMTMTDTADAAGTARQCVELWEAGSEMVRVTVNLPEAAAAVPEVKQRMLDAGCTAPLIGDFHYNGHLLLTRYPGLRQGAGQVPHQSRQRRHGKAPRRTVLHHLPGGHRPRQAGPHRRQRRLAQSGAGHGEDAGEHRQGSGPRVGRHHQRVHGALGAAVHRARHRHRPDREPDHHLVQGVAAASPHRRVSGAREADAPAAASRADRGGHGHQGPGVVGGGDGRAAERRHRRHHPRFAHAATGRGSPRGSLRGLRAAAVARHPHASHRA